MFKIFNDFFYIPFSSSLEKNIVGLEVKLSSQFVFDITKKCMSSDKRSSISFNSTNEPFFNIGWPELLQKHRNNEYYAEH